jgi:hypothetical protein
MLADVQSARLAPSAAARALLQLYDPQTT